MRILVGVFIVLLPELKERAIGTLDPDVKFSVDSTTPTDVGTQIDKLTDLFYLFV